MPDRFSIRLTLAVSIAIAVATLAVYAQTASFPYVHYDDSLYVTENPRVLAGLTASGVAWAFSTFYGSNWHPFTWLSHMLDCELLGVQAGPHHLMNVALHVTASILLLLWLARMTQQFWRSAMVAAIFALHPLHVESVAWVAERKDVLSASFAMLTLLLYTRYAEKPTRGRYAAMAAVFAAGLMSKPMLVTLPFVMLLLDVWPLRRMWRPGSSTPRALISEKIPLFAMAAISSVLTFLAQRGEPMIALNRLSIPLRLANATVAYARYLEMTFWPARLGVLYPFAAPSGLSVVASLALLLGVSMAAWGLTRRRPYFIIGWLWYLGILVPVIGIVQVGNQAVADRYMYLPMIGLSIVVVWSAADWIENHSWTRPATAAVASVILLLCGAAAFHQTRYWQDSRTLYERTLAVTRDNFVMENNLGMLLADQGRSEEAMAHVRQALAIKPDFAEARVNLGQELLKAGKWDEAYPQLTEALRLNPDIPLAHLDLVVYWARRQNLREANGHIDGLIRLAPGNATTESYLCFGLQHVNRLQDALVHCDKAIGLNPNLLYARFNRAVALAGLGQKSEALAEISRLLSLNSDYPGARDLLIRLQS